MGRKVTPGAQHTEKTMQKLNSEPPASYTFMINQEVTMIHGRGTEKGKNSVTHSDLSQPLIVGVEKKPKFGHWMAEKYYP